MRGSANARTSATVSSVEPSSETTSSSPGSSCSRIVATWRSTKRAPLKVAMQTEITRRSYWRRSRVAGPERPGRIGWRGYNRPMPDGPVDADSSTGEAVTSTVDVDALFQSLREQVRLSGADPAGGGDPADRRAARDEAERLWPVSADRSLRLRPGVRGGIGTPVKAVLRKMMRWYVEPLAYDQRSFNAAALRLVDDLQEQVDRLQAELAALRNEKG